MFLPWKTEEKQYIDLKRTAIDNNNTNNQRRN